MGILFLTVKQERCSDLLLWFAAWLLPPLRLRPKLMLTTATATALDTDSATPVLDTALASATLVLDTPTARGRPRLSPRLMLTTLTDTVSATPDSATPDSATLDSATLVSDTLVS